jgi:hypothetical protein
MSKTTDDARDLLLEREDIDRQIADLRSRRNLVQYRIDRANADLLAKNLVAGRTAAYRLVDQPCNYCGTVARCVPVLDGGQHAGLHICPECRTGRNGLGQPMFPATKETQTCTP